ncbi:MAG: sigma-70 family RNA polymerase sigma factor [Bacteroidota bacterium]
MSDLLLWQALKAGKKSALERIYSTHIAGLLKYGRKFSRNDQVIEDCIQDLFIELWKNRAGLGMTDSIQRYLLVALRRKIIRQLDKSKKWVSDSEPTELDFDVEIAVDQKLIELELSSERAQQVKEAMENLSKRQKEVIYLKYVTGLDYEDIGEIMDLNYQSVRNLVSKALKKLKGTLLPTVLVLLQVKTIGF